MVENIWQFMRDNWLSNHIFESYNEIVGHCCDAWNKLISAGWYKRRPRPIEISLAGRRCGVFG